MENRASKERPEAGSRFEILDFEESQYESIRRVHNRVYRDYPRSLEELMHDDEAIERSGHFLSRLVATKRGSGVVGYGGMMERVERYQPGTLYVEVAVDPRLAGSSLWESLYRNLEERAKSRGTKVLKAEVSERDSFGRGSWREVGFEEKSSGVESRVDLGTFGYDELGQQLGLFKDGDITFSTLAREKRVNPDHELDIIEMERRAGADVPVTDRWSQLTPKEYHNLVFANPSTVPAAWFIAKRGSRYIGESYLVRNRLWPHRSIGTGFTCVIQEYRGKGIARHLKLVALKSAKAPRVRPSRTWNDSENRPMLGLNKELGFERHALSAQAGASPAVARSQALARWTHPRAGHGTPLAWVRRFGRTNAAEGAYERMGFPEFIHGGCPV